MIIYRAQLVCTDQCLFTRIRLTKIMPGVDFKVKVMDVAGPDGRPKRVKVTIWDTGTFYHLAYFCSKINSAICSGPGKIPNSDEFILSRSSRHYIGCDF